MTNNKVFKAILMVVIFGAISLFIAYQVSAAPTDGEYFLRVEVKEHNGDQVSVSAPLSLLQTIYDVLPKDIMDIAKQANLTPDVILQELESLEGQDLVNIRGQDNVRVWFEPVKPDTKRDLGFVRIQVKESGENGNEINICVPRGLVQLVGTAVKQLELTDRFVDLPDEIKQLKYESPKTAKQENN